MNRREWEAEWMATFSVYLVNLCYMALNIRNFHPRLHAVRRLVYTKLHQPNEWCSPMALWKNQYVEIKLSAPVKQRKWNEECKQRYNVLWSRISYIIVVWLLKVHPPNKTAMCCQECCRYAKPLIKLIPTELRESTTILFQVQWTLNKHGERGESFEQYF